MKTAVFAGFALAATAVSAAQAMPHCGARNDVINALADRYAETHRATGLQSATGLLEIWASDRDGTWTILLTRPDGQTCVMASGTHWLEVIEMMQPAGAPA